VLITPVVAEKTTRLQQVMVMEMLVLPTVMLHLATAAWPMLAVAHSVVIAACLQRRVAVITAVTV
jgi:hypothetical protein